MHSGTVWNDREHFENNDAESCILISYSIWFGTAKKTKKQGRQIICAFWCYFKRFWKYYLGRRIGNSEDILNDLIGIEKREKKFANVCILVLFETVCNCREKNENKDARSCEFWCYLKRFMWNCNKKNVFTKSRLNNLKTR